MVEELKIIISAEISKFKKATDEAKKKVKSFKEQVKDASADVEKNFKNIGTGITSALKKAGIAIAAAGAALLALGASTEEYRNQQAQLITAFEAAGGSAETAKETYNDLYRVLGDGGQAQEAAQHLAKLTTNEKALSQWTKITQGVYATFGASLPIESLTEAANETAKTGQLTGALADALNWAGINEEDFQAKLDACNKESEREALIRGTLNQLYSDAANKYEENNAAVLAQRDAQLALQEQTAKVGEALAPVMTAFTNFGAQVLALVAPYIEQLAANYMPLLQSALSTVAETLGTVMGYIVDNWATIQNIAVVIGIITAAIALYNTVAAIKAAMAAAEVASVWGLVSAYAAQALAMTVALAPYILIAAAIAALVAGFLYLWNNCEGFREFWINLWENLKTAFNTFVETLKPLIAAIWGAFQEAWEVIKIVWDKVKPYFTAVWESIKAVFSAVVSVLGGFFRSAWQSIQAVWNVVVGYFTMVWNNIKAIFSVVKSVLKGDFQGAWDGIKQVFANFKTYFQTLWNSVKQIFSAVGSFFRTTFSAAWTSIKNIFASWATFFTGLWDKIKAIFSNVATAIADAVKSVISTAVNKVLSAAIGIINGFIGAINTAIGIINKIPGVSISKLSKLDVPAMARGGIVDSATLAVVGEAGKEAVVPLENNLEWLDKLAGMLNDRMGGGTNAPIVLTVDGKVFAQTTIDSINQLTQQTGRLGLVMA